MKKNNISYQSIVDNISEITDNERDIHIFNTIDTKHDGVITLDELKVFIEKRFLHIHQI